MQQWSKPAGGPFRLLSLLCVHIQVVDTCTFSWCWPGLKIQGRQTFIYSYVFKSMLVTQGNCKLLPISSPKSVSSFYFSLHSVYTSGATIFTSSLGCSLGLPPNGLPVSAPALFQNDCSAARAIFSKCKSDHVTSPSFLAWNFKSFPLSLVERPKAWNYCKHFCTI